MFPFQLMLLKFFINFLSINKKRQCDLSHFPINLFPLLIDALINDKDLHFTHLISRICFLHLLVLLNPASIRSILVSTTRQTHQSRSQHTDNNQSTSSAWVGISFTGFLSFYPIINYHLTHGAGASNIGDASFYANLKGFICFG